MLCKLCFSTGNFCCVSSIWMISSVNDRGWIIVFYPIIWNKSIGYKRSYKLITLILVVQIHFSTNNFNLYGGVSVFIQEYNYTIPTLLPPQSCYHLFAQRGNYAKRIISIPGAYSIIAHALFDSSKEYENYLFFFLIAGQRYEIERSCLLIMIAHSGIFQELAVLCWDLRKKTLKWAEKHDNWDFL